MRRKGDRDRIWRSHDAGEFLLDLRNMAVLADLIGLQRFMGFRKMIGQGRAPSCSGDPGFRIDDDGIELDESLGEERRQLQDGRSRIAAR